MWLHRHFHGLISFAARTYYEITVAGEPIPRKGPVLLVANHPNSLMDPALVAVAADRPVRFLARAPLFEKRTIGWLIKGTGAIPVYRRIDDPELLARNEQMLSAAEVALAEGAAVGIFPEGVSHSAPSLAPLKTGAARIALGASRRLRGPVPILPVGITFRGGKERFRSDALLLVGAPVEWDDLFAPAATSPPSLETSRELTRRIHNGLSGVTVNLESWKDFTLVEGAEAIHDAEFTSDPRQPGRRNPSPLSMRSYASRPDRRSEAVAAAGGGPAVRWLVRMRRTAEALEQARKSPQEEWEPLARDVVRHMRILHILGLTPRDLHEVPRASVALRWTLKNLLFFGLALPLAFIGMLIFFPAYQLVARAEPRFDLPPDRRATYLVLGGTAAFGGWILLIAAILRELMGWRPALWALALLPLLGLLTVRIRDRWRDALADLRRILLLRGRKDLRARLLERQAEIAARIRELQRNTEAAAGEPGGP